jgi:hypothetical protein
VQVQMYKIGHEGRFYSVVLSSRAREDPRVFWATGNPSRGIYVFQPVERCSYFTGLKRAGKARTQWRTVEKKGRNRVLQSVLADYIVCR